MLGWCAKQVPDAKGKVIGYGKERGFPSRVVAWEPDQVEAAYRFARSGPARSRREILEELPGSRPMGLMG